MRSVLKIGLTGGIGSGKSTVANFFAGLGMPVYDADIIARELTEPGMPALAEIRAVFGADYLDADGRLRRDRLAELVFADTAARRRLEAILHPRIYHALHRRCRGSSAPYVLLVIPLLVESGGSHEVDRVLVVDCPEETQLARARMRGGADDTLIRRIIASQAARAERLRHADDIIDNSGDLDHLRAQVEKLHARYLMLAGMRPIAAGRSSNSDCDSKP